MGTLNNSLHSAKVSVAPHKQAKPHYSLGLFKLGTGFLDWGIPRSLLFLRSQGELRVRCGGLLISNVDDIKFVFPKLQHLSSV